MDGPCAARVNPLIDHLARVARARGTDALGAVGLRLRHVVALTVLREAGDSTQAGLAPLLRLDPSNVVGLLNELEGDGLVVRRRDPSDRRRHVVALTDAGHRRLAAAEEALGQVEDELFARLDAGERTRLHALLAKALETQPEACVADVAGACAEAASDDGVQPVDALDEGRR